VPAIELFSANRRPSEGQISLIVGLGNPGRKYELTRHNIGATVAKAMAQRLGLDFKEEKRFHCLVAKGIFNSQQYHIVLPTTYMNESGRAVKPYMSYYALAPQDLLVVSDDVELPFGELRLRLKGSSGGHNGLKSIEAALNTREYSRLKCGVGKTLIGETLADYVLAVFNPEEFERLPSIIGKAVDVILG